MATKDLGLYPWAARILPLILILLMSACSGGGDGGGNTVSLSGTLEIPGFVVTDSDVNDVNTTPQSNDTPASAQVVPNPSNVGGYVNSPRAGADGTSWFNGDVSDFYKVELEAGQTILLNIADSDAGDLDLALYDESVLLNPAASPVALSQDISKYESIVVENAGTYFLQVYAYTDFRTPSSYSNYLLSIGLTPVSELQKYRGPEQGDFVAGQLLAQPKVVSSYSAVSKVQQQGFTVKQESAEGVRLLDLDGGAKAGYAAQSVDNEVSLRKATLRAMQSLRASGEYEFVEPNYRRYAYAIPDDEFYGYQWHYPMMNLPAAWDVTTSDASVVVAVIDTGVLVGHPDLAGQLVSGYDFISDSRVSGDGDGIDSNADDPGDGGAYSASSFHGTHVAGTIAASSNNAKGVSGVAWGARIMPVRVLGQYGGNDYDIAQAIRYAAGLSNDSGTTPAQRADIINLSLGGAQSSTILASAVAAAIDAGVIVIAAAGNESTSTPSYPAAYSDVVSVSAVDMNRELAPYSNYGSSIDVAAPGGDTTQDLNGDGRGDGVLSTAGDDSTGSIRYSYAIYQGTSMAAPHVAGVAALMKSIHSSLTPAQFNAAIQSGALTRDIGNAGRDNLYGYGLVDAYKAVVEAQNLAGGTGTPVAANVLLNPQSVSFGFSSSTATLYVDEVGSDGLAVNSVVSGATWLTYNDSQVDGAGFGPYTLSADRDQLSPGTYSTTLTVNASNTSLTTQVSRSIDVLIQVLESSLQGDAGLGYVLLIDADTGEPVDQDVVALEAGSARYGFSGVAPGQYLVIAGSDMNQDDTICDAGEACGAYPSDIQPQTLEVSGSRSDLDFLVTYTYESPATSNIAKTRLEKESYKKVQQ